jgi:hypothetical protein
VQEFSLSWDSSSSSSMITLSIDIIPFIFIIWYRSANSEVAFWCTIVVLLWFPFLLALMFQTCAGAYRCSIALLASNVMCSSIVLSGGMFTFPLNIHHLSAILEVDVGARSGSGTLSALFNIRYLSAMDWSAWVDECTLNHRSVWKCLPPS